MSNEEVLIDALADAPKRGWTVIDMKQDWREVWSTPMEN
jgi:hypothetical protein